MKRLIGILVILFLSGIVYGCQGGTNSTIFPGGSGQNNKINPLDAPGVTLPVISSDVGNSVILKQSSTSDHVINGWSPGQMNYVGDVTGSGDSAVLASTDSQIAVAWLKIQVQFNSQTIPYLTPYSVDVNTTGTGEYWFAVSNFGPGETSGYWKNTGETYSAGTENFEIGLSANAGWSDGFCWLAVITAESNTITLDSIELHYPDVPPAGVPVNYEQFIETDDGVHLATNIFLPYQPTFPVPNPPYPVVLLRTPYDKESINAPIIELTQLGVVVMVQYFRGRLEDSGAWPDSDGTETLFREHNGPDYHDAIDTMEWIEARNLYNGTIVLSGPSALGLWIYQAAPGLGDRIAGIYPQVSCGNVANWAAQRNGCFKESNVEGWLTANGFPAELLAEARDEFGNDTYWDAFDFDSQADQVMCPGYHEVGWWDVDVEATIKSWKALNDNGGTGAAGNQWLIIGPWSHETVRDTTVGGLTFPNTSDAVNPSVVPGPWDGLLWGPYKLGRNPLFTPPTNHVRAYFIGEEGSTTAPHNNWYEFGDWPPAYTEEDLFLFWTTEGLLEDTNSIVAATQTLSSDPTDPIGTIGGANLPGGPMLAGPYDQTVAEGHADVLAFRSDPLTGDLSIAGPITITLTVSTNDVSPDFMVKLIDQYPGPDNRNMLVADSAIRLTWWDEQNGGENDLTQRCEVTFEIGNRAYVFGTGHRIGIDIQGTNYPRFAINPGNGDKFYTGDNGVEVSSTLYFGDADVCKLTLPVFDPSV